MDARLFKGSFHLGTKTANAGTAFYAAIPPKSGAYTKIHRLVYTTGTTAHTLSILKAQGKTTTSAAAAASDTALTLTSINPAVDASGASLSENLAASDFIVVQHSDGTWGAYLISAINTTTKVVTINALAKAVASGAVVYAMHELARTTGKDSIQITTTASSTQTFETYAPEGGIASSAGENEPLIVHSNNATAAGSVVHLSAIYSRV